MGWIHGQNEIRDTAEENRDRETRRLQETRNLRKTTSVI